MGGTVSGTTEIVLLTACFPQSHAASITYRMVCAWWLT
jgi:hypothetical protein